MKILKYGFTLAEILITLSIIGVIASMTIPSLVQDVQEAQYKTAWKKIFADLNQATKRIILDYGGSFKGVPLWHLNTLNLYLEYLNYTKKCSDWQSYGICWHKNDGSTKLLNGESYISGWPDEAGAVLNNGMTIIMAHHDPNCSSSIYKNVAGTNLNISYSKNKLCGSLFVDVNGFRGPNTYGKDIFGALILERNLVPVGSYDNKPPATTCIENNNASTNSGLGCAAKYLYQ